MRWADLEERLDEEPPEYLNNPNISYEIREEYGENEAGQRTRTVSLVRILTEYEVISKERADRARRLRPFGCAAECGVEANKSLTARGEDVEIVRVLGASKESLNTEPGPRASGNNRIACRNCGGNHWTSSCTQPRSAPPDQPNQPKPVPAPSSGPAKYVPPTRRRDPGLPGQTQSNDDEDKYKIRLGNLSDGVSEDDLRDLIIEKVGRPHKVFLVRDKVTRESRGFAFVSFFTQELVDKALKVLEGHRFEHMVLHAEKAKRRED